MFQTIWFFVKIALISITIIWMATQEGDVSMSLMGYTLHTQVGVFLVLLCALLFLSIFLYRVIRAVFSMPKTIAKYRESDKRKKSFRALTCGLVAVAAGDAKKATSYSKQTKSLWPDLNGLPLLLEAQAAKLRGEEGLAQNKFEHLLKDKEAAFLGVRGLLKNALDEHDHERALGFARQAEKQHPKKPWVIKCVYELEIKNRLWRDALRTNQKARKFKVYSDEKIMLDRVAIYLHQHDKLKDKGQDQAAQTEVEKAYKLDPYFIPTVTRYCDFLIAIGKKRKAISVVEKAWRVNAHPDLAVFWTLLAPLPKGKNTDKDNQKIVDWAQRLITANPDSVESHIAAAKASMDIGYWGEAKAHLMVAEKLYPSAKVYRLQVLVEQNSTHNEDTVCTLMERATSALPDKVWVCHETGMIYEEWRAIAKPHGAFNTIVWDYASARPVGAVGGVIDLDAPTSLLLDPA